MKQFASLLCIVLSQLVLSSCDEVGRTEYEAGLPGPQIVVLEKNVPADASLDASIKFQITSGMPPYHIYPDEGVTVINEEEGLFEFAKIRPGFKRFVVTVMDSDFKSDTTGLFFPIPEVVAQGLFKHEDGTVETINYKFENYGSEGNPNYVLSENVYSNMYSFGDNKEVEGEIAVSADYEGNRGYSRYKFNQAYGMNVEDYDEESDSFYHPKDAKGNDINIYNRTIQGICPSNWHIPNNDEWLETLKDIGLTVNNSPSASDEGAVFGYRYMYDDGEKALFEEKFNTGYSYANGTYPSTGNQGVGYWSSSMTKDFSQYVLYFRYNEGNMPLEAWGGAGTNGRHWYVEHVRCKFDF